MGWNYFWFSPWQLQGRLVDHTVVKIYLFVTVLDIEESAREISKDLCKVAKWCYSNKVPINPDKTKLTIFGVKQILNLDTVNIVFSKLFYCTGYSRGKAV